MAKIAIVGCGAMGSVYAALMVDAGHEVHAVTLWPDHAEAMPPRACAAKAPAATALCLSMPPPRRMGSGRAHSARERRMLA
jgi:3-hydroxyisobutyrate dehydrogenase-like beta-hydroxyacid dehydrogenase